MGYARHALQVPETACPLRVPSLAAVFSVTQWKSHNRTQVETASLPMEIPLARRRFVWEMRPRVPSDPDAGGASVPMVVDQEVESLRSRSPNTSTRPRSSRKVTSPSLVGPTSRSNRAQNSIRRCSTASLSKWFSRTKSACRTGPRASSLQSRSRRRWALDRVSGYSSLYLSQARPFSESGPTLPPVP